MSIDLAARLDVQELLARFCHVVDHADARGWRELFTHDACISCSAGGMVQGSADIAALLDQITQCAGPQMRHLIIATVFDRGTTWRDLKVTAYGPVLDLAQGGAIAGFYDYEFHLRLSDHWRIRSMVAQQVGSHAPAIGAAVATGSALHLATAH